MADGVFNIAKGRVVELYNRVESNDPAAAILQVVLGFGTITDAVLRDLDSMQAILDDVNFDEATFTAYGRKDLGDAQLATLPAPDDTADRYEVTIPNQTWSPAGGASNNDLTRLLIVYAPSGAAGADSGKIPLTFHDFVVTTDGSDLTAQINASGFFRAS